MMTAATRQIPYHMQNNQLHNDEHSALSLKGYVRSSLRQYVRSSLHCINISRAMDDECVYGVTGKNSRITLRK